MAISCLQLLHTVTIFFVHITARNFIKMLQIKCHLKINRNNQSNKSAHIYIDCNNPISFILFICSVGVQFCFRRLKLLKENCIQF